MPERVQALPLSGIAKSQSQKHDHRFASFANLYNVSTLKAFIIMAANPNRRRGVTLRTVPYQTGKSNIPVDVARPFIALKPGYRISANGHRYYEARKNRSDLRKRI